MRPLILCRERLERIQRILERVGGSLTVREFSRTYSVREWEVEQAAALGWVKIETHKPRTGRPSRIARTVSECPAAKLPPWRCQIEKPISIRHANFAFHSVCYCVKGGSAWVGMLPLTVAYRRAFPAARKRRAATASMSRLMRHPDVKAARAWLHAKVRLELHWSAPMPESAKEIWQRLRELKSSQAAPALPTVQ
ncbi:MAG: hypothetical protein JNM65_11270 [Verrucomicrobiaceae bacterium]|nr:hypothetical protein [Verrucomicrobiaceae bacterium]